MTCTCDTSGQLWNWRKPMYYETRITIPKSTLQAAPVSETMLIHPGVLQAASVYFPPGCCGLAHVQVYYQAHLLFPTNPDAYFTGDDVLIEWPEDLEIIDPPYEFSILGWNDDDTYPHTPIVRVQIIPNDRTLRSIFDRLNLGPAGAATAGGG